MPLLLWRRPHFLADLLLTPKTWSSHLLVFIIEDLFESVPQILLVVYFALKVNQQGISYSIMFSIFLSALKMIKTGYSAVATWQREKGGHAGRVHAEKDVVLGSALTTE